LSVTSTQSSIRFSVNATSWVPDAAPVGVWYVSLFHVAVAVLSVSARLAESQV
jgi:hypothetical protein